MSDSVNALGRAYDIADAHKTSSSSANVTSLLPGGLASYTAVSGAAPPFASLVTLSGVPIVTLSGNPLALH